MNTRNFGLLIADDNPKTRENYQEYLTEHPNLRDIWVYDEQDKSKRNVLQAGDAYSALQAIKKFIEETSYHMIVLTDAYMPPNSDGNQPIDKEKLFGGLKLIDEINKNKKLKERVTVILITFYDDDKLIKNYRNRRRKELFNWRENRDYYFISKILSREDGLKTEEESLKKLSEANDKLKKKVYAKTFELINARINEFHDKKYNSETNPIIDSKGGDAFDKLIGESQAIKEVREIGRNIADKDVTVLITGATGTGKEVVARAIHSSSNRADRPFIPVNCGAIPSGLIESELFGSVKGAYNGATNREGHFEAAKNGTIFLDEIGEAPVDVQVKLLRVLESGEYFRVGASETKTTNARVIVATHQNLSKRINESSFREDLYHRISTIPIHIPPLEQRKTDIPLLIAHFWKKYCTKYSKRLSLDNEAIKYLTSDCTWTGNVRELQNVIDRSILLAKGNSVTKEKMKQYYKMGNKKSHSNDTPNQEWFLRPLEETEKEQIIRVLEYVNGNVQKAANILKVVPQTVYNKMEKFNISI